ncbi:MAG: hypothetical protein KDE56_04000, partial [Anaerolineales bacterium]|nr:hypothetical protein [Anaerolineales bacterium]
MNLDHIPILDHHAHPLLRPEAIETAVSFQQWFTESTHPATHQHHVPHSLFFRTGVKWLAEMLGCEAEVTAVLAARNTIPHAEWIHRLFTAANISMVLCDYGYSTADSYTPATFPPQLPRPLPPLLRIE